MNTNPFVDIMLPPIVSVMIRALACSFGAKPLQFIISLNPDNN